MRILPAQPADADELLALQKAAFQSEAALYGNWHIAPLTQTRDELIAQFDDHVFLKAVQENRIVGSVRAKQIKHTCFVGRLAVAPDCRRRGIGSALTTEIETFFPSVQRFELFTGAKSTGNIRLYEKLGYTAFKTETDGCGAQGVEIVFMEKLTVSGNN